MNEWVNHEWIVGNEKPFLSPLILNRRKRCTFVHKLYSNGYYAHKIQRRNLKGVKVERRKEKKNKRKTVYSSLIIELKC